MPDYSLHDLLHIMSRLRDKETGCPWDVEQNFATIAPYTIEEAYEVAEAIANDDMENLREELGDLLLQVVFHSQMADEAGLFNFADVTQGIADKLVRRHPHVFDTAERGDAASVTARWEAIKAEEKKAKPGGVLADVPLALPALTRALKLQKKAAKVGFDWPDLAPVFAKLEEEISELQTEITTDAPLEKLTEELGDVLFVCANLARKLGVDPEEALRATNKKFERRFKYIEDKLKAKNKLPEDSTLEEMDALWDEAKQQEKAA